ncbi:hypothetical protein ACGFNU_28755 [Spirillospora sp. NPDC048911]|uniref:hypothetical protein n=1 Tax=Spirillospora sp. NPDC048911 TaxID=3364527 RepID=UPI003711502D
MSKKFGALVAVGAAALMISTATGCKVEINQSGKTTGGSSPSGSGSGHSGGSKGSGSGSGSSTNGGKTTPKPGGTPRLVVSDDSVYLVCPGDDCTQEVTLRNTGTAAMKLYSFVMLDDANFYTDKTCANYELKPGYSCTFRVSYRGPAENHIYTARLVIHQNLPGDPTYIALTKQPIPA